MILRPYKKIKELELEIEKLKDVNENYSEIIKRRKEEEEREKKGLHNPTASCMGCKNFINTGWELLCKKDCKCKDRQDEN